MKIPNELIRRLVETGDMPQEGWSLVVGPGGGTEIKFLAKKYLGVIGIEKNKKSFSTQVSLAKKNPNIVLKNENILDTTFKDKSFQLIIARNVLPFLNKKDSLVTLEKLTKYLDDKGYLLVTFFGPRNNQVKSGRASGISFEDICEKIKKLPVETYFQSTEEGYGPTLKGSKKYWHIHKFILKNNKI